MRFIALTLREIGVSRLLMTAVYAAGAAGLVVTTPVSIPAGWGSVVLALAVFGFVHLADIPLSWLQARFTFQAPSWSVRTWSLSRRWYGPGQPVRTTDGQIGTAIEWTDSDTDVIWVLIKSQWATSHTSEWRPLTDLSPHPSPQQALTTR